MLSEKEFIKAIQQHEQILHKVCHMYMHDKHNREDLFQEIVLNAWKGIKQFRQESKFSTWLYRVALNTAITMFKKEKKKAVLELRTEYALAEAPGEDENQYQAMRKAIEELTEIDKALVMLYFEDYSHQEMATITGLTVTNIAVKMNRIKNKLKAGTKKYL